MKITERRKKLNDEGIFATLMLKKLNNEIAILLKL